MTDDELRAIRERCEKATVGPWEFYQTGSEADDSRDYVVVCASDSEGGWDIFGGLFSDDCAAECFAEMASNYQFAAHARADIPALLAEVERLRGELAALKPDPFRRAVAR